MYLCKFAHSRTLLGKVLGLRVYVRNEEWIAAVVLLAMEPVSYKAAIGRYLGYAFLVVIHELGHAFFAALVGWVSRSITIGVWGGYCAYGRSTREGGIFGMLDFKGDDDESFRKKEIFVSWGGVAPEIVVLGITLTLRMLDLWPNAPFFRGLGMAFTTVNASMMIVWNLLPREGRDGETAWRFLRRKVSSPGGDTTSSPSGGDRG